MQYKGNGMRDMRQHKKSRLLKTIKTGVGIIQDIIEKYIPIALFLCLFVIFLLQVVFRYVFNHPLIWTQDVIVFCFCWVVVLGASYTMRIKNHVLFTLVYDNLSIKLAALSRMLGSIIIIATFIVLLGPSYTYCQFLAFQKMAVTV